MKKTILIVDDDLDLLLQMKLQLEAAGYAVITAEGRKEAEALLSTTRPDLAVLDLMMEDMDAGFLLSRTIKLLDATIPVIIVTAVTRETGMEFGVDAADDRAWIKADVLLAKPVRFEQLLREMQRLLP